MPRVRIGLDMAQQRVPWEEVVSRARLADALGFDGIWGFDHFQPMYGSGPGECFEGWTTLAALAGVTSRVRLGLLVTGNTYRHPSVLASEVITVDHASGGRVEFSLGAAWFAKEHHELGLEFPSTRERIDRLDEALQVIRLLLTTDDVSFAGRHYQLRNATLHPRAGAAAAPADLDRGQWRTPDAAPGRSPRRCLALLRRCRGSVAEVPPHRRTG